MFKNNGIWILKSVSQLSFVDFKESENEQDSIFFHVDY